jgi:hypothetical protein
MSWLKRYKYPKVQDLSSPSSQQSQKLSLWQRFKKWWNRRSYYVAHDEQSQDARDRTLLKESIQAESPVSEALIVEDSSVVMEEMILDEIIIPSHIRTDEVSYFSDTTMTTSTTPTTSNTLTPRTLHTVPPLHPNIPFLGPRLIISTSPSRPTFPLTKSHMMHPIELLRRERTKDSFQGSLESIDSLIESYWDPDDVESTVTPVTGNVANFVDFFSEHVHFLRVQTQPRQVEVVWAKQKADEKESSDDSIGSNE